MTELDKLVIEWRDAREAFFAVPAVPAGQRFPSEIWTRLGHAEHALMDHARHMERPIRGEPAAAPTQQAKLLTPIEVAILEAAIAADPEPIPYSRVYRLVGSERAWHILDGLKKAGAMDHPRYGVWTITEKGRIALALYQAMGLAGAQ